MGTRSITRVISNSKPILTFYRQMDGYPSGHGKELFEFLDGMTIGNGLSGAAPKKFANGAGCLAAQMIKQFKDGAGGIYMMAPRVKLEDEDYGYEITVNENMTLTVVVKSYDGQVFKGSVAAFGKFCAKEE